MKRSTPPPPPSSENSTGPGGRQQPSHPEAFASLFRVAATQEQLSDTPHGSHRRSTRDRRRRPASSSLSAARRAEMIALLDQALAIAAEVDNLHQYPTTQKKPPAEKRTG